ncbi:MAG: helix-turn-helix domain-containing protein [Chloroflexota bacterium]
MPTGHRSRDEFRFDARYGRLIRTAGIATIPFALYYYQGELELSPQELWLIGYVLAHRWTSDLPFPAVRELARRSGVTTKTIEKHKKSLEARGFLEVVRRTRADGGNTSIGWDFSTLFDRISELLRRDREVWARRNTQLLEDDEATWADDGAGEPIVDNSGPVRPPSHRAVIRGSHGAGEDPSDGADEGISHGPRSTGRTHVEEDPGIEDPDREDAAEPVKTGARQIRGPGDSSSNRGGSIGSPLDVEDEIGASSSTWASPLIDRIVEDYSARLHDAPKSFRSNCTRARHLWTESDLAEDDFVGLLHQAYRRTQENSHRIRKSAKDGPFGTKNKMPYFFSVLRSLIEEGAG